MVKNTLSSKKLDKIHVEVVRKRRYNNNNNISKVSSVDDEFKNYSANTSYGLSSKTTKSTVISNTDPLSLEHNDLHSNTIITSTPNNDPILQTKSFNQSQKRNLTWKDILLISAFYFLLFLVITALILPSVVLYITIPRLFQIPINQTNISEPIEYVNYCVGVSPYSSWGNYALNGITMPINTSNCHFNSTPLYFTSIAGIDLHNDLTGYNAIYAPTKLSFQIYILSTIGWTTSQLLNYSNTDEWNVNWIGFYY